MDFPGDEKIFWWRNLDDVSYQFSAHDTEISFYEVIQLDDWKVKIITDDPGGLECSL